MDQKAHIETSYEAIDELVTGETITGNGEFTLTMNFYRDNNYTDPIVDVPVQIFISEATFVQLELKDATDPSLILVHHDTVATLTADYKEGSTDPHYYLVTSR